MLVLVAVVVMVNLGLWQLRRLDERQTFNDTVGERTDMAIVDLQSLVQSDTDPSTVEWRRVETTGSYLADQQVIIANRSQGGVAGRDVVDALRLRSGDVVLVDRGFVDGTIDAPPAPTGEVRVIGRLRSNFDVDQLAEEIDVPVLPIALQALQSEPAEPDTVEPVPAPRLDEGSHLSYAIQWAIFSVCALAGWVFAIRRTDVPRRRRTAPPIADELSRV